MYLLRNSLLHRKHVCIFALTCMCCIYFVLPLYSGRSLSRTLHSGRLVSQTAKNPRMILERLSVLEHPRAICIDSSPAAFYHNIVDGLQEKDVIIYLAGGGHCFSSKQCQQRSVTQVTKNPVAPG